MEIRNVCWKKFDSERFVYVRGLYYLAQTNKTFKIIVPSQRGGFRNSGGGKGLSHFAVPAGSGLWQLHCSVPLVQGGPSGLSPAGVRPWRAALAPGFDPGWHQKKFPRLPPFPKHSDGPV